MAVRDNGPGIPHELYDKIFTGFYQYEPHFSGNVEGLGIGLLLARRIMDTYGGDIWVESRIPEGSTFRFRVPAIVVRQAQ